VGLSWLLFSNWTIIFEWCGLGVDVRTDTKNM
jgi:hypothetical protein